MYTPLRLTDGLIFDTRSILFTISGVFFGFIPTLIGVATAVTYRIVIGGAGVYVGIATIVFSATIGLLWKYVTSKINFRNRFIEYIILGLISQGVTLLTFLFLPRGPNIVGAVAIPYLVIFPTVLMIISVVIENQRARFTLNEELMTKESILNSSIDSTKTMGICAINKEYKYLAFNLYHANQVMTSNNHKLKKGDSFLDFLNEEEVILFKSYIDRAISGDSFTKTRNFSTNKTQYFEMSFTPIETNDDTIGAAMFIRDITKQREYEEEILKLSYFDTLTNLQNRRSLQEHIRTLTNNNKMFSAVVCDINGLKIVNDAFGHSSGDELLTTVGQLLKSKFQETGFVFRMGGDEFTVLAIETTKAETIKIMELVVRELDKKRIKGLNYSLSYGVADRSDNDKVEEVIRIAEEEMYKHKLFETASYRSNFIKTILQSLHEKNPREEMHSQRVSNICVEIGKKLKMSKSELNLLKAISSLHDIGKIAIDEAILNKPGKLTDEEWKKIKQHPEIGYRIISSSPEHAEIAYDILSHHERYDGAGYPQGLKGEEIPIRARIVAIADAYDAMISKRTYRDPLTKEEALAELVRCRGTQFDPELVDIFLELNQKNEF